MMDSPQPDRLAEDGAEPSQVLIDDALGDAWPVLAASDAPFRFAPELVAALRGPAMRAVLEQRIEQIAKHGHTADSDGDLPLGWLPKEVSDYSVIARQCIADGPHRNLARGRRSLAKTAALCLAAIDRIDRAIASGEAR